LYTLAQSDLTFGNIWVITLFSLAGVPPLAGFFSKFLILTSAINNSFFFSVIIILIFSTISSYYYLNFIRYILFEKKKITNLFFFI
jgi:NADH:ubiquinone oxidoreductase subunit 2 (subunit N)